jgi:CheY-like chemotaxis protein
LRLSVESAMNEALIAEDEPVSRRFLDEALQMLGWQCSVVEDGAEALAFATARRFGLLVFDVNLPRLDGITLLTRLRADPDAASHDVPALALTADHGPLLRERLLQQGFAAVGHKPIALDELARRIDATVGAAGKSAPTWDEAAALRTSGGRADIVRSLRELMRRDLPAQRANIERAWKLGDDAAAQGDLHRLRAASGFCGAAQLAEALDRLHRGANPQTRHAVLAAIDAVLASN